MGTITIDVDLSVEDVKLLNEEYSQMNSSFMSCFIESILKKVARKSNQMLKIAYEMKEVNYQYDEED